MKQIYPITVAVLVVIAVCCSVIGVRPATAKKTPAHAAITQGHNAPETLASGQ